jgi:hypothetical protein
VGGDDICMEWVNSDVLYGIYSLIRVAIRFLRSSDKIGKLILYLGTDIRCPGI